MTSATRPSTARRCGRRQLRMAFGRSTTSFYVLGLALGDVVQVVDAEGALPKFSHVVRDAGHGTIRVVLSQTADVDRLRTALRDMGCSTELSRTPLRVAVDVPPTVNFREVSDFICRYDQTEVIDYDEGCLPTP